MKLRLIAKIGCVIVVEWVTLRGAYADVKLADTAPKTCDELDLATLYQESIKLELGTLESIKEIVGDPTGNQVFCAKPRDLVLFLSLTDGQITRCAVDPDTTAYKKSLYYNIEQTYGGLVTKMENLGVYYQCLSR